MDDLIKKYCLYLIDDERDAELLEEIKLKAQDKFPEYQKKARSYVQKLKEFAAKYNTDIDFTSFYNLLQKYIEEKDQMTDEEKKSYLLLMRLLAEVHSIDLKKELEGYVSRKPSDKLKGDLADRIRKKHNDNVNALTELIDTEVESSFLISSLSNPLDNEIFLKSLLFQRYNNGSFEVREISLPGEDKPQDTEEYNESLKNQKQAELMVHLYSIFIDKMNNYAKEDINPYFAKLIGEEDLIRLSELNEQDICDFLSMDNEDDICRELNISHELYAFIVASLRTTDYTSEHIGEEGTLNLFTTPNSDKRYTMRIYLNSPARSDIYDFLNYYINKCVEKNINYNMKGLWGTWEGNVAKDRTVLYADTKDIDDKIAILDEIKEVYPETVAAFGAPICACARINDSYYGISHAGYVHPKTMSCLQTYNDYFNGVCEVAYYRTLAKLIINLKELRPEDKEQIQAIINLNENEIGYGSNLETATFMKISSYPFGAIKDTINKYIPNIIDTLDYYFNNDEHITILSDEFKKSIIYISNILQKREKKTPSNIAVSSYMEAHLPKEMSNQFNI